MENLNYILNDYYDWWEGQIRSPEEYELYKKKKKERRNKIEKQPSNERFKKSS